jgi:hypothetical protein
MRSKKVISGDLICGIQTINLNNERNENSKAILENNNLTLGVTGMSLGPGKYDLETTMVQKKTNAQGVILIIIDGKRGSGFSVQATLEVTLDIPGMLRTIADEMEADISTMEVKS